MSEPDNIIAPGGCGSTGTFLEDQTQLPPAQSEVDLQGGNVGGMVTQPGYPLDVAKYTTWTHTGASGPYGLYVSTPFTWRSLSFEPKSIGIGVPNISFCQISDPRLVEDVDLSRYTTPTKCLRVVTNSGDYFIPLFSCPHK